MLVDQCHPVKVDLQFQLCFFILVYHCAYFDITQKDNGSRPFMQRETASSIKREKKKRYKGTCTFHREREGELGELLYNQSQMQANNWGLCTYKFAIRSNHHSGSVPWMAFVRTRITSSSHNLVEYSVLEATKLHNNVGMIRLCKKKLETARVQPRRLVWLTCLTGAQCNMVGLGLKYSTKQKRKETGCGERNRTHFV